MPYRDPHAALAARLAALESECERLTDENEALRGECQDLRKRERKARAVFRVMAEARQLSQRLADGKKASVAPEPAPKPSAPELSAPEVSAPILSAPERADAASEARVALAKEQASTAIQRAILASERAAAAEQRAELAAERAAFAEAQALLASEQAAAARRAEPSENAIPPRTSVYKFVRSAPRQRTRQPSTN